MKVLNTVNLLNFFVDKVRILFHNVLWFMTGWRKESSTWTWKAIRGPVEGASWGCGYFISWSRDQATTFVTNWPSWGIGEEAAEFVTRGVLETSGAFTSRSPWGVAGVLVLNWIKGQAPKGTQDEWKIEINHVKVFFPIDFNYCSCWRRPHFHTLNVYLPRGWHALNWIGCFFPTL